MKNLPKNIRLIGFGLILMFSLSGCDLLNPTSTSNSQPIVKINPNLAGTSEASESLKLCMNKTLGISFSIPKEWDCIVDEETLSLTVDSDLLYMEVFAYGEDFCAEEEDCTVINILSNDTMDISEVDKLGIKEIRGTINDQIGNPISSIYNIRMSDSSPADVEILREALNSVKVYL